MDLETWESKFKPVDNHIDNNSCFDGKMFETFGPEYEFVCSQPPERVWTFVEVDGDYVAILHGFHRVNRMGYFVTEVPGTKEDFVELSTSTDE
jgi:hypothetical protein